MAAVIGEKEVVFRGLTDVNPYDNTNFITPEESTPSPAQIFNGRLTHANDGRVFWRWGESATKNIIKCRVELDVNAAYWENRVGCLICNPDRGGYYLVPRGTYFRLYRQSSNLDDGIAWAQLHETASGYGTAPGDHLELTLDITTGNLSGYLNDVELFTGITDTSYGTDLAPGLIIHSQGDVAEIGIFSWAGDGFTDGPMATLDTESSPLVYGSKISGTYENYASAPTELTLTDPNGNVVTMAITTDGDGLGNGTFETTGVIALPAAGTTLTPAVQVGSIVVTVPEPTV